MVGTHKALRSSEYLSSAGGCCDSGRSVELDIVNCKSIGLGIEIAIALAMTEIEDEGTTAITPVGHQDVHVCLDTRCAACVGDDQERRLRWGFADRRWLVVRALERVKRLLNCVQLLCLGATGLGESSLEHDNLPPVDRDMGVVCRGSPLIGTGWYGVINEPM